MQSIRPIKDNCLVILHNFFWSRGRRVDFFFQIKSKLREIFAYVSPKKGATKSTLPKNLFI